MPVIRPALKLAVFRFRRRQQLVQRSPLLARRLHKWLALLVGVQAVIWAITGLYMVSISIDVIHGDHLVRRPAPRPADLREFADPMAAFAATPGARTANLHWLLDRPTLVVAGDGGRTALFDARTGARLPPPSPDMIRRAAQQAYAGNEPVVRMELLRTLPMEVRRGRMPLWRVEFAGWNKPTLYLSPASGELVTRRHELWRIFDFAFGLHVMDYADRTDVNNPLLRTISLATAAMALSGTWLLLYSFKRRRPAR